jgi:hypothetical protein
MAVVPVKVRKHHRIDAAERGHVHSRDLPPQEHDVPAQQWIRKDARPFELDEHGGVADEGDGV